MSQQHEAEFRQALLRARSDREQNGPARSSGIGTLGEKTLHAAIKYYVEPDPACHEVPYLGFVADVKHAAGVVEVQTRSFDRLRRKLAAFLEQGPVTLVCPLAHEKYLLWLDPDTGEVSSRRKSPKTGRPWHLLPELDRIRDLLDHPRLSLLILLLDVDEYRNLDGWSRDRKRGSTRREQLPLALREEIWLRQPADWQVMLPAGLPAEFTRQELMRRGPFSQRQASAALRVLQKLELCREAGKQGRAKLYRQQLPRQVLPEQDAPEQQPAEPSTEAPAEA